MLTLLVMSLWAARAVYGENSTNISSLIGTEAPSIRFGSPLATEDYHHRTDRLHCPSVQNAVSSCPSADSFVYYTCCGGADMYCCEHFQTWVLTTLGLTVMVLSIILIFCLIRCCCSYKHNSQQCYSFEQ